MRTNRTTGWFSLLLTVALLAAVARAEEVRILPSQTDPAIKTFDTTHCVYPLPATATNDRHELLLWIPGTQPPGTESKGGPGAAGRFCEVAAGLGYHAIVLKYPNDESAAVGRQDSDPAVFEKFRMAIIAGGSSRHITVSRADSIENRLIKLLLYLRQKRPAEDWGRFLTAEDGIRWEAIAVAGQSQGGGHAAWLRAESATPVARFFALNHQQDHQGCSPAEQLENLRALKLEALGKPVDVDKEAPPYRHSHILTTNYPGTKLTSKEAHGTGISPRNEAVFGKVWTYMLTEKVP